MSVMKIIQELPLAVSSNEIDGQVVCDNQFIAAIKERGIAVASTNLSVSVVVPGVHLTLERGAIVEFETIQGVPRATSTENSGYEAPDNQSRYAAAQE